MEQSGKKKNDEYAEALSAAPRRRRCFDDEKSCNLSCIRTFGKVHNSGNVDTIVRKLWRKMQHGSAEKIKSERAWQSWQNWTEKVGRDTQPATDTIQNLSKAEKIMRQQSTVQKSRLDVAYGCRRRRHQRHRSPSVSETTLIVYRRYWVIVGKVRVF